MPCTAKKFEIARPEHHHADGYPWTDAVLTTREAIFMIKSYGIEFTKLPDDHFDEPLGQASGAGDIFGITGGVLEATLRTAAQRQGGGGEHRIDFEEVRAVHGLRETTVQIGGKTLRVGIANGLNNARKILDEVLAKEKEYHVIEVMACPGGCSGGGGQPYPHNEAAGTTVLEPDKLWNRGDALYALDKSKQLRRSIDNPNVKKIYEEFLGEIGSPKAHELLHTGYKSRLPRGIK
jgi:iron only hydrogenase large subunit-like protein